MRLETRIKKAEELSRHTAYRNDMDYQKMTEQEAERICKEVFETPAVALFTKTREEGLVNIQSMDEEQLREVYEDYAQRRCFLYTKAEIRQTSIGRSYKNAARP